MATLLEIVDQARRILPDFAEGDYKVNRGEIAPADHPMTRVMDTLRAKAKAEGKSEYTFLGRVVPVDRDTDAKTLLAEMPQGELEDAAMVATAAAKDNITKQFAGLTREGMEEIAKGRMPSTIGKAAYEKGLRATKSAKAPNEGNLIQEFQILKDRLAQSRDVVQTYEGVLEREAQSKIKKLKAIARVATSKPVRATAGAYFQSRKDEEY